MSSLFDKVRVAVLGNLHELLGEVANTPKAYKQRIRDLEAARADILVAVDEAAGTGNGYRRQIEELRFSITDKDADINLLLGDDDPSNDEHALTLQVEVDDARAEIESLEDLLAANDANRAALDQAVAQIDAKHREMSSGLRRITMKSASTKAKDRASAAVEAATSATSTVDSIDSIEAEIDRENDRANARFDRVVGGMKSSTDPVQAAKLARAKAELDARRAQIAAQAKAPAPTDAPAPT